MKQYETNSQYTKLYPSCSVITSRNDIILTTLPTTVPQLSPESPTILTKWLCGFIIVHKFSLYSRYVLLPILMSLLSLETLSTSTFSRERDSPHCQLILPWTRQTTVGPLKRYISILYKPFTQSPNTAAIKPNIAQRLSPKKF